MRGYRNYRGRNSPLKRLAVIGMVAVLLLAAAYLFISEFKEYDSDGNAHIVLPWQKEDPAADGSGDRDADIDIVYDEPEDLLPSVQAVEYSVSEARQGESALRAKLGEGNAAALWLKRPDGCLRYHSDAAGPALCFTDGLTGAELQRFTAGDTYTIARLSCMKDNAAPMRDMAGLALTQENGYVWYGSAGEHYLDLAKSAAREYLIALVLELADAGFDEVLMSDLAYPADGVQSSISTAEDRTAAVTAFLKELKEAVKDSGVKLSLELSESAALAGSSAAEGISLAEQLPLVNRVYVQTEHADAVRDAVGAVRADMSVVIIGGEGTNRYIPQTN